MEDADKFLFRVFVCPPLPPPPFHMPPFFVRHFYIENSPTYNLCTLNPLLSGHQGTRGYPYLWIVLLSGLREQNSVLILYYTQKYVKLDEYSQFICYRVYSLKLIWFVSCFEI